MFTKNEIKDYAKTVHSLPEKKANTFASNFLYRYKDMHFNNHAEVECRIDEILLSKKSLAMRHKRGHT